MTTILVFISLILGLNNYSDNLEAGREMQREKFYVGQTIYRYEDYINNTGKIIAVRSNGVGYCRGQIYRKIRLPFASFYKEQKKEGELDSCSGEVFRNGQWVFDYSMFDKHP